MRKFVEHLHTQCVRSSVQKQLAIKTKYCKFSTFVFLMRLGEVSWKDSLIIDKAIDSGAHLPYTL